MLINIGVLLSRLLVGGVFLIAGFAKLKVPASQFISAVLGYELLPVYAFKGGAMTIDAWAPSSATAVTGRPNGVFSRSPRRSGGIVGFLGLHITITC